MKQLLKRPGQLLKKTRLAKGVGDTEKLVLDRKLQKNGEHDLLILLESQLEISILEKFEADLIQFF